MTMRLRDLDHRIGTQLLLVSIVGGAAPVFAGRYQILSLRGRGAHGLVCLAEDRRLGRHVALKLYPPSGDAALEAQVDREARALARLDHPNVVRVHDVGRGELVDGAGSFECLCLCMEFHDGKSLRSRRADEGWSRDASERVLLEAGEGLAAAHAAGLVHRDFKPENVMVDERGRGRVIDFGLAGGLWTHASTIAPFDPSWVHDLAERMNALGRIEGTREYMAPEAQTGETSPRSDQFSFAVTLWECLTDQLPFDPDASHLPMGLQLDLHGAEQIPRRLRDVLRRALSDDPGLRYPDMTALLRALRATRRRRWPWLVGGAATIAAAAALSYGLVEGIEGPKNAPREDASDASGDRGRPGAARPGVALEGPCDAIAGRWFLDRVVTWSGRQFANDRSRLDVEIEAGCSVLLTLTDEKGGPDEEHADIARAVARPTTAGTELSADFDVSSDGKLRLNMLLTARELRGDWGLAAYDEAAGRIGVLVGGREREDSTRPAMVGQPCRSLCRALCMGVEAAHQCIASKCRTESETFDDCGRPPRGAPVPRGLREHLEARAAGELLGLLMGGARVIDGSRPGASASAGECKPAARSIAGTEWRVWRADLESPREVHLRSEKCDVGDRDGRPFFVDDEGKWSFAIGRDRYALVGFGPAFGVTGDNIPVAAYRVE